MHLFSFYTQKIPYSQLHIILFTLYYIDSLFSTLNVCRPLIRKENTFPFHEPFVLSLSGKYLAGAWIWTPVVPVLVNISYILHDVASSDAEKQTMQSFTMQHNFPLVTAVNAHNMNCSHMFIAHSLFSKRSTNIACWSNNSSVNHVANLKKASIKYICYHVLP